MIRTSLSCHISLLWPRLFQTSFPFSSLLSRLFRLVQAEEKMLTKQFLLVLTTTMSKKMKTVLIFVVVVETMTITALFVLLFVVKIYLKKKKDYFLMSVMSFPVLKALFR